jgi:PIN domain nuclease of toxin-antitoxin system
MAILDTCVLLWLTLDQKRLSPKALSLIKNETVKLYLSSISVFEISLLLEKKKLQLHLPLRKWLSQVQEYYGLEELPITSEEILISHDLPLLHRDPADRFLIATAFRYHLNIITPDHHMRHYKEVTTIW